MFDLPLILQYRLRSSREGEKRGIISQHSGWQSRLLFVPLHKNLQKNFEVKLLLRQTLGKISNIVITMSFQY